MQTILLGYLPMKQKKGKVIFVEQLGNNNVIGNSCEKYFLYDALSDKIVPDMVGSEIYISFTAGYDGKAYPADVTKV